MQKRCPITVYTMTGRRRVRSSVNHPRARYVMVSLCYDSGPPAATDNPLSRAVCVLRGSFYGQSRCFSLRTTTVSLGLLQPDVRLQALGVTDIISITHDDTPVLVSSPHRGRSYRLTSIEAAPVEVYSTVEP